MAVTALAMVAVLGVASAQTDPLCTTQKVLSGSNFEIDTNANLKVDDAQCIDWLSGGTGTSFRSDVLAKNDSPSGASDESFGKGTAEDNPNPTIVNGSIPPNKSDLKAFGVFTENDEFLELFWSRVQNPSGTTNMDFELNQEFCDGTATHCANNGSANNPLYVTPKRTDGDVLVTYDLSRGGTVPAISIRFWDGTNNEWGPADLISDGASPDALGSINTSLIPATETGGATGGLTTALGAQDPFTFGEAAISFDALFGQGACGEFGSAYLKSRSSDSFTSELKDFVPPERVNIGNCPSALTTTATGPVDFGQPISDTAHLTGASDTAGGTITFKLYGPSATAVCTDPTGVPPAGGNLVFTDTVDINNGGPGDYTSGTFTPTAPGSYYWTATYSGDATNAGSQTACGDANETSVVNQQNATVSSTQEWLPNDTATVNHGGSVTFTLLKNATVTDDHTCSGGTQIYTAQKTLAETPAGSGSFTASTTNTTNKVTSVAAGDIYTWKIEVPATGSYKAVTSCVEATEFASLDNGGTVTSP